MARSKHRSQRRDPGRFVALPWQVIDSAAYRNLTAFAKALLIDIARQYNQSNNGALRAGKAYMQPLGWNSTDTLTKAKRELLDAGLLFETVKGARPNRASWYALTWYALDKLDGFDPGAAAAFERGAYQKIGMP